jgi:hypothetical protein
MLRRYHSRGSLPVGPGEPLGSIEAKCQIDQVLRNDVLGSQDRSLLRVECWRDADSLLCPPLILRKRMEKSPYVLLEVVDIRQQRLGRAFAGAKTDGLVRFVDGHQIDLGVGLIPETLNSMRNRKIPDPLPASLLVEFAGEVLQGPALDGSQVLIGFINQVANRAKRYGGNRISKSREPCAQEIASDAIPASLRFGLGKNR